MFDKNNLMNVIVKYSLILVGFFLLLFILSVSCVEIPEEKLHPKEAYRFYDRNSSLIALLISEDDSFRVHVPVSEISPMFLKTLVMVEDRHFYHHFGVNPFSVMRAACQNLAHGRVVSGGSTITMQLARMLERRDRTFYAKILETIRAIKLELIYSKEEILGFYLANAPYGGNIEGIQAASLLYFGKPASTLSAGETALLVGVPRSPSLLRPDRHPNEATRVRNRILNMMLEEGLIGRDLFERSLREPVNVTRRTPANRIPHYAWKLRLEHSDTYEWRTTIDESLQLRVNRILSNSIEMLLEHNITNAAAVVLDNRTRKVLSLAGSLDYYDTTALGANDGAMSPRSPGSTLKPFLYGLGFQEGAIAEKTVLYDIPVNYGGYSPRNYSREFSGLVRVDEALTESLNVVAVRLSREIGHKKLYQLLCDGGVSTLDKPAGYYGLPLVLGGVEISLTELCGLYSALANGGIYKPVNLLETSDNSTDTKRILSDASAWMVSHILRDVERPDFPESWRFSKNRPDISWKTGTSYGHQDAWSIGYTPEYTIGVWVGNFDGTPSKGLAGSSVAAPILFDLFQAVAPLPSNWFSKPDSVQSRYVCQTSGLKPSRHCGTRMKEYYIKGIKGHVYNDVCSVHQEITIDKRYGKQASDSTSPQFIEKNVYEIWPPEIATFLLNHGVPVRNVPPYSVNDMAGQATFPPVILSPVRNTVYYKRPDRLRPEDHAIKLQAAVSNRSRKGFWFLNNRLIGMTDLKTEILINPPPGDHRVKFMDDIGGTAEVALSVKDYRELKLTEGFSETKQ